MKIRFLYSQAKEKEKLLNIHKEYQWFIDYNFPIILPEFYARIYRTSKRNKFFIKELKKELNKIYNKNNYRSKLKEVRAGWQKIERRFFAILKDFNFKTRNRYICYISLYGPEGQFKYPNIINLRANKDKDIKEANISIAHEIIHLLIFNKVKRLKLNYRQVEGIVDLFFKKTDLRKLFPKYKLQCGTIHNKKLFKRVFKKN